MQNYSDPFVRHFRAGMKDPCPDTLGVEAEHFLVDRSIGKAVSYSGEHGGRAVLRRLMACYPAAQVLLDDDFFGFTTPEFNITLEPAAQLEISIAPMCSIPAIRRVYEEFRQKLDGILDPWGLAALTVGGTPQTAVDEMELIPKERYRLMDAHFQTTGTGGREMMRGTASLQVSIDYRSETDFRRKLQAASFYAPMFKLLCDNTSRFQGQSVPIHLKRTDIWNRTDSNRCGILPDVFKEDYCFQDYADFLWRLVPVFRKTADGTVIPTGTKTIAELFPERQIPEAEVPHLLSMAFPDVRLKQFLELRFADSVPAPFQSAYCALIKGLLCRESGLDYAQERIRTQSLTEADIAAAERSLMEQGWQGEIYGQKVADITRTLLDLARSQLEPVEQSLLEPFDIVMAYGGIGKLSADILARLGV